MNVAFTGILVTFGVAVVHCRISVIEKRDAPLLTVATT